ncbi:cytochrome P450 [Streptomyces sp. NPDC087901]|uniref:cytochrome P450 n=1 Tax=Streptomyces sp. NPDC087901 TaxID=3365818 RepID=UPI0037F8E781
MTKPVAITPTSGASPALVFPQIRPDPYTPPPQYRARSGAPLHRCTLAYGGEAWLVTGLKAAREILADSATFSSDTTRTDFPPFPLASKRHIPGHFLSMDPPEHTRLRGLAAAEFSAGRVRQLRPAIESAVSQLVDDMVSGGGPADVVEAVTLPLPAITAARLLGTPAEDRDFFLDCVRDMQMHDATPVRRAAAAGRLNQYLERLLEAKRRDPADDLLSGLASEIGQGNLSLADAIGAANLIVMAGLETTSGLLSLALLSLLTDEQQARLVRSDPRRWCGPAIGESLRYWTVVQHGVARVATRDTEVAGCPVRAGDAVVVSLPSVNRDPEVYPDPGRFDVTRDVQGQLAFGHGVHRCLGSFLAQTQAELALAELIGRLPGLRLAVPADELMFLDDMLIYGVRALPVEW